jgi:ligand-binding sensor domain-containing protein/putative methionine-R-sulfoxide reductase with GAF domain
MRCLLSAFLLLLFSAGLQYRLPAQLHSFHHLNRANGLSDNNIRSLVMDRDGLLWVGTADGLNVFDGYSITSYSKEQVPEFPSNSFAQLTVDSSNRLWICFEEGICWMDAKRKFHRVTLQDTISQFNGQAVIETKSAGLLLQTDRGQFNYNPASKKWEPLWWLPSRFRDSVFMDVQHFEDDKFIFVFQNDVVIFDYAARKIIYQQAFSIPYSACRFSKDKIAVGLQPGVVDIVNIHTKELKEYRIENEENGTKFNTALSDVAQAVNGQILVSTNFAGLITIDSNGTVNRFTHDPLDPGSLGGNSTSRVLSGSNGEVIVGTYTSGVSIVNINYRGAAFRKVFRDRNGDLFDGFINEMEEDRKGILWIAAYDRLIRWDQQKNESKFYYQYLQAKMQGTRRLTFRALAYDNSGTLWASVQGDGVVSFDEATGKFTKLTYDTTLGKAMFSYFIHDLLAHSDGTLWACNNTGIFSINPKTRAINTFVDHPVLKQFNGKRIICLFEDSKHRVWLGTGNEGVYRYDPSKQEVKLFTTKEGLINNTSLQVKEDKKGNIYVATIMGFSIINDNDKIISYTKNNGLKYNRCFGLLCDDEGNMWVSNDKCLVKYYPESGNLQYFSDNAGVTISGFRIDACFKKRDGELIWGSQEGINYFYPEKLLTNNTPFKVTVYQAALPDSVVRLDGNEKLTLPFSKNAITFRFTAVNINGSGDMRYQYKLEGIDKDWQKTDIREARYTALASGNYTFRVKASPDGVNWITAGNEILVVIIPPFWQRWWFIGALLSVIIGTIYYFIVQHNNKIREKQEEIETEQVINYFASSMSEQQTEDDILWDVAKNCIGRLQFEDCVIYLVDDERDELVQKAAHGPKSPREFEISSPIGIPMGKGIVGSVGFSGRPEIVPDTSKDPRYIVDDVRRLSEITVPIISDGKVLGVIDCEHSKKGFFTQKHLSILTTIASLCANKIVRARAEEERRKAQVTLMNTQQKMTEVEMQALRAQMNPHFIFNCLNSINRYIVKSDQTTASLYLTKFAKLIRLILDNSNTKNVILTNELEALKLYIEMEALRFDRKFTYEVKVENRLGSDTVELPPLIIQPYVENAIWHGLLHKETNGHLSVRVSMNGDSMLECVIEDNGVGRDKAKELRSKSATSRKSLGMQLTENRLSLLNKHAELNASVEIIDLKNGHGEAAGTKVILKIPV